MVKTLPTGNEEVDRQIGGGLPLPSLMLIEGEHGTGKSALVAQFMKGMLDAKMKVLYITTESNIKDYIAKMKKITFDFSHPFLQNRLSILEVQADGLSWKEKQARYLLPVVGRYMSVNMKKYDVAVIDSLSVLCMHADTKEIMDFFTRCKYLVSNGMSIIMTFHPAALNSEVALRVRSTCDCYVKIKNAILSGKSIKVMEVIKFIGSSGQVSSQFSFEVDTIFGIKIVPISMANA
jgi:flagellar protein FlaH